MRPFLLFFLPLAAWCQLIPAGQPIPRTGKPPVVFLNGYQRDCGASTFAATFGVADQVLQANQIATVFFDNCSLPDKPSIEKLGAAFGTFLSGLKFADGAPVDKVDVVAHSMGGLIVRAYLSGKQDQQRTFTPPAALVIRRAVFLATPHFGTPIANLVFGSLLGSDPQGDELSSGSHFLYDLNTWNDNTDDLRGIDAVAVAGNGGTGRAVQAGLDDGVVATTSASLGFYLPGRTRILPLCHVNGGGLVSLAGFCSSDAKGVAHINSATDDSARIIVSFLNGDDQWRSIGQAAEQNQFLSTGGALWVRPFTASGETQKLNSAIVATNGQPKNLNQSNDEIGWTDLIPAGTATITASTSSSGTVVRSASIRAGAGQVFQTKPGPTIDRVLPAAASTFPLTFAPRTIVSLYGVSLASSTDKALNVPLPMTLGGTQVLMNGSPLALYYASAGQINAVLPDSVPVGLTTLSVQNSAGSHTVNLMAEAAHPSIFTASGTGSGAAAALVYRNGQIVTNSVRAGDTLALFLTGLGATTKVGDLDYAVQTPTVSLAGVNCPVSFAGGAPGYPGLDQINCVVPTGLTASPNATVTVSSGGRISNSVSVAVQ